MDIWHENRLWTANFPLSRNMIQLNGRMNIIKLNNGDLLIHSPSELTENLKHSLTTLGVVRYIVSPNNRNHMFLSDWWITFPDAYFFAPPDLAQQRPDLRFDGILNSAQGTPWQNELLQTPLRSHDSHTEIVFCDPHSRTLLLGDTLTWLNHTHHLPTFLYALLNGCYFSPNMPKYRQLSVTDHQRLRESIVEIAQWPFERILLSHGSVIHQHGKEHFLNAFAWLLNGKQLPIPSK